MPGSKTSAGPTPEPVVLNLLAFAIDNACNLMEPAWQAAEQHLGTRTRLSEPIRTLGVSLKPQDIDYHRHIVHSCQL